MITDSFNIVTGGVIIYCDNQGALDNVFNKTPKRGIFHLLERDYDLLGIARAILAELSVKITGTWVKGHYNGPDWDLQHDLNDWADTLAGTFWRDAPQNLQPRRLPENHPSYEAVVYYDNSSLTAKLKTKIYEHKYAKLLRDNIVKNTKWDPSWFHRVSWSAYEMAFHSMMLFKQITIAKLSHGLLNTGAQKHLYNPEAICCGLSWWILTDSDSPPRVPTYGSVLLADIMITSAFSEQGQLGWDQLLRGRVSSRWGKAYA